MKVVVAVAGVPPPVHEALEASEAASHKVVAATALWQEGLRTNFYQRIMATEQSEKTEENKV